MVYTYLQSKKYYTKRNAKRKNRVNSDGIIIIQTERMLK